MGHVKPNGTNWRHGRGRRDLSAEEAAAQLHIKPNPLRNIESNQPRAAVSLALALRASQLYKTPIRNLVVGWHRPSFTASKDEWVAYAVGEGAEFATAAKLTKADLMDLFDGESRAADEPEEKPAEQPKPERKRDPSSPPPRKNGKDNRRGPRRDSDSQLRRSA